MNDEEYYYEDGLNYDAENYDVDGYDAEDYDAEDYDEEPENFFGLRKSNPFRSFGHKRPTWRGGHKQKRAVKRSYPALPIMSRPRVRRNVSLARRNTGLEAQAIAKPTNGVIGNPNLIGFSQFDMVVTVTASFIAGANAPLPFNFPFVLFAKAYLGQSYKDIIAKFVPTGWTLSVARDDGGVNFRFTNAAMDTVVLYATCPTSNYNTLLEGTITEELQVPKIRETISNATKLGQLSQEFRMTNGSMFGLATSNPISAVASKSPNQYQDGIVDFNYSTGISKYRGMLSTIATGAIVGEFVTYSFWCKKV